MSALDPRISATVAQLLQWLVARDFSAVEKYTHGIRLSAAQLEQAVRDHGRTLAMPPQSVLGHLDAIEIEDADPRAWSIRLNLWTLEEDRSDLSLEFTLIDGPAAMLVAEIDNLHVL